MTKLNSFKTSKLLTNNWVITLSATLIGVFLALYLNERMASKKNDVQKKIAAKNILSEITSNHENIKQSIIKHSKFLAWTDFSTKYMIDEKLIVSKDSMNKFRNQHPNIIRVTDSTHINNNTYHYEGITNVDFSMSNLELTTIAWETLKNSGISSTYDFECLMYLETIQKLINEVTQLDQEFLDYLYNANIKAAKNEKIISYLELLIMYEKGLNETFNQSEKQLKNCD